MKRLLVIFLFVILPISAFAEIHGFFEFGKALTNDWAKAEVEIQWWMGQGDWQNELYGGWETWMRFNLGYGNSFPFTSLYTIGNRVHYKHFYFGLELFCIHPIWSDSNKLIWNDVKTTYQRGAAITYIGVEW